MRITAIELFKLTETGLKFRVIREKGIRAALAIKKRKEAQT